MGCLGNGITVCNSAVMENGDYKKIAHIANCGKITWYVNPTSYIPSPDLLKIEHVADASRANWEKWLDSMPEPQRYEKLLDAVPLNRQKKIFLWSAARWKGYAQTWKN